MKTFLLFSALTMQTIALSAGSIQSIPVKDIDGKATSMKAYDGKVLLIVNVASHCGFTPQYKALEAVYEKYKDKGFAPFPGDIKWNFTKFLVGRDGKILKRFESRTTPDSPEVLAAIDAALGK